MHGVRLISRPYLPFRPGWEHDHCEFCGTKISQHEGDTHFAWSTTDSMYWVCPDCFTDFKNEFAWTG